MVTTATGVFPYRLQPLNNISAFTYRTGVTYAEMLEELRVYINDTMRPEFNSVILSVLNDFQAGIENAETRVVQSETEFTELMEDARAYVDASVQFINNKTGQAQIQRVTLTAPYTVSIDPLWPNNHPINIVLTQDAAGGHVVTWDSEDINGTLPVSTAPNAETDFWLIPEGDGTWSPVQYVSAATFDAGMATKANASALATTNSNVAGLTTSKADKATTITSSAPLYAVAGVLRNTGAGWNWISDAGHEPIGIDSVSSNSSAITVNYGTLGASKVGSFIVVPDEKLSEQGFQAGASVGTTSTDIYLSRSIPSYSDYVAYSSGAFVSANGVFTCTWDATGGYLQVSHPTIIGSALNVSLTGRPGTALNYTPVVAGDLTTGSTFIAIEFRNAAGAKVTTPDTNMRVFVTHGGGFIPSVDPSTVNTTTYPNSNLWVMGLMRD